MDCVTVNAMYNNVLLFSFKWICYCTRASLTASTILASAVGLSVLAAIAGTATTGATTAGATSAIARGYNKVKHCSHHL